MTAYNRLASITRLVSSHHETQLIRNCLRRWRDASISTPRTRALTYTASTEDMGAAGMLSSPRVCATLTNISQLQGGKIRVELRKDSAPSRHPSLRLTKTNDDANTPLEVVYKRGDTSAVPGAKNVVIPSRLVDYFIVYEMNYDSILARPREAYSPLPYKVEDVPLNALVTAVDVFPKAFHPETPFSQGNALTAQFAFVKGATLLPLDKATQDPSVHFSIITQEDGSQLFGAFLTFYFPFPPYGLSLPKVIAVISHVPLFSILRQVLFSLYRHELRCKHSTLDTVPIERYLHSLVWEVPVPLEGSYTVSFSIADTKLYCSIPPLKHPLTSSVSLHLLFSTMHTDNVVKIFTFICKEQKLLFHSSSLQRLVLITQSFLQLLYPFHWGSIYIPTLGENMFWACGCPRPFIMGVLSENLPEIQLSLEKDSEIIFVDVDADRVTAPEKTKELPLKMRVRLNEALAALVKKKIADCDRFRIDSPQKREEPFMDWKEGCLPRKGYGYVLGEDSQQGFDSSVYLVFLRFFSDLIGNYRRFLLYIGDIPVFNAEGFLLNRKKSMRRRSSLLRFKMTKTHAAEAKTVSPPRIRERTGRNSIFDRLRGGSVKPAKRSRSTTSGEFLQPEATSAHRPEAIAENPRQTEEEEEIEFLKAFIDSQAFRRLLEEDRRPNLYHDYIASAGDSLIHEEIRNYENQVNSVIHIPPPDPVAVLPSRDLPFSKRLDDKLVGAERSFEVAGKPFKGNPLPLFRSLSRLSIESVHDSEVPDDALFEYMSQVFVGQTLNEEENERLLRWIEDASVRTWLGDVFRKSAERGDTLCLAEKTFRFMSLILTKMLDVCSREHDFRTADSVNRSGPFFYSIDSLTGKRVFLESAICRHSIFRSALYWNSLLDMSVEEWSAASSEEEVRDLVLDWLLSCSNRMILSGMDHSKARKLSVEMSRKHAIGDSRVAILKQFLTNVFSAMESMQTTQ